MGVGSWGGGVVLLIAAVLWLVYLIPSWAARRQYLATERNAIRLQQTLRILAQSAEVPEEVRVEMNAKSLAEAQRVAKSEEARRAAIIRAREAARQREITRRLAAQKPELERASAMPALTTMRIRRSRLGATAFGTAGVVVAVVTMITGMWLIALAGLLVAIGSAVVLWQLHQVSIARRARGVHGTVRQPVARREGEAWADPAPPLSTERSGSALAADRSWNPTDVPKPLYVEQPKPEEEAESAMALAARLRERVAQAKAEAEAEARAIRASAADPSLARVSRMRPDVEEAAASLSAHDQGRLAERIGLRAPAGQAKAVENTSGGGEARAEAHESVAPRAQDDAPQERTQPPSKWASMGLVDPGAYERPDLDAAMRRRRAV